MRSYNLFQIPRGLTFFFKFLGRPPFFILNPRCLTILYKFLQLSPFFFKFSKDSRFFLNFKPSTSHFFIQIARCLNIFFQIHRGSAFFILNPRGLTFCTETPRRLTFFFIETPWGIAIFIQIPRGHHYFGKIVQFLKIKAWTWKLEFLFLSILVRSRLSKWMPWLSRNTFSNFKTLSINT